MHEGGGERKGSTRKASSWGTIVRMSGKTAAPAGDAPIEWLSTGEAANRLGITARTLYRFIDQGELPGYRFGRVIRVKASDVESFIEASRIEPGSLEHLYPEPVGRHAEDEDE
jgi:excisionase family DNA binding protein